MGDETSAAELAADTALRERAAALDAIRQKPETPVLIVGGGIVGAGLFRELALQGVDVLLVDKGDFGCGASAAPSRMIHGGLRYLEFGEFRLVNESVVERNRLLRVAPHYIKPLPTTIPVLSWFSGTLSVSMRFLGLRLKRPPDRGWFITKIGLMIYDFLSRKNRVCPKHSFITPRWRALKKRPSLNPKIVCTATYYDAQISYPERLVLELLLDGEELCGGARALNYVALHGAEGDAAILRDELTGETFEVKPRLVVNAAGPWIDFANRALGHETEMIGGTKGAHLVLENPELVETLGDEQIFYETPEGRVCIAFVWQGKALIGSTDIKVDDPEEARVTEDEIDYMLQSIRNAFPTIEVNRSQILSYFTGVRPLAGSKAATTGQASRAHRCIEIEPTDGVKFPVFAMVGGKWTPFRVFSEHVADKLLPMLDQERRAGTVDLPIGGGKNFPRTDDEKQPWLARVGEASGLTAERLAVMLERYGTRSDEVAAFCAAAEDRPLEHHPAYTTREIEFILRRERVLRLDDLVLRRTAIALLGELTPALFDELLDILASLHNWTAEQKQTEATHTKELLSDRFGIKIESS